jgi:hypothetical protein
MSAYLGNSMSIFLVAYLINNDLKKPYVDLLPFNFFESMGTGLIASFLNIFTLYACFKLDKALARQEEANFFMTLS